MNRVAVGRHYGAQSTNLQAYRGLIGDEQLEEIWELAAALRRVRVCHINSTAAGGGVAELLAREVPLFEALGLTVHWWIIRGEEEFFTITKGFHNALQGSPFDLTPEIEDVYVRQNEASARIFADSYDLYIVHDPQPAALCRFRRRPGERWVWRSHIDTSTPNPSVWRFLRSFVQEYDAAVFTLKEFVPPDLGMSRVELIPPAIDPLSTKNMALSPELCRQALADLGVDLRRPVVLQVSRFDRWKDPLGLIQAYRLAHETVPDLQLVLVGALAADDPEGWSILEQVNHVAATDPNILVYTNMTGIGNMEVNVFQRGADLIVQKSLKEGFGLVVSEALWKGKAVVAGNTGGIPIQIPHPYHSYLVESLEDCARKIVDLLDNPELRQAFGEAGRRHVREHFLLPRLVRDDLRLIRSLTEGRGER